ncbi:cupin domain-containing protein [Candidatus Parcubacteria bacterium]|nr:MAG: cupin domain-containing protein [Candidatus Parcubacteria bacterium]
MASVLAQCAVIRKSAIDETLGTEPSAGKRLLEPLKSLALRHGLPINILEDYAVVNEAEVHRHESDLWQCLEGEVTFVYGGELVEPWAKKLLDGGVDDREIKASEIRNGTEVALRPGDWLWIPAGQPHAHRAEGTARLVIIKIPAKDLVALEAVPGWK